MDFTTGLKPYARRLTVFNDQVVDQGFTLDGHIAALQRRVQIGTCSGGSHAIFLGDLIQAKAFLTAGVKVIVQGIAPLPGGFHHGFRQGIGIALIDHAQGPADTMVSAGTP